MQQEEIVNKKVLNAFSREFPGAKDVQQTITKHRLFIDENHQMHFTSNGELMAMSRNINSLDLHKRMIDE